MATQKFTIFEKNLFFLQHPFAAKKKKTNGTNFFLIMYEVVQPLIWYMFKAKSLFKTFSKMDFSNK